MMKQGYYLQRQYLKPLQELGGAYQKKKRKELWQH